MENVDFENLLCILKVLDNEYPRLEGLNSKIYIKSARGRGGYFISSAPVGVVIETDGAWSCSSTLLTIVRNSSEGLSAYTHDKLYMSSLGNKFTIMSYHYHDYDDDNRRDYTYSYVNEQIEDREGFEFFMDLDGDISNRSCREVIRFGADFRRSKFNHVKDIVLNLNELYSCKGLDDLIESFNKSPVFWKKFNE